MEKESDGERLIKIRSSRDQMRKSAALNLSEIKHKRNKFQEGWER